MDTKALKKQMGAAIAMVLVAAVALGSATFAWFVTNNKVDATTTNIAAQSNAAFMTIANGSTGAHAVDDTSAVTKITGPIGLYPATFGEQDGATKGTFMTGYGKGLENATLDGTLKPVGDPDAADTKQFAKKEQFNISSKGQNLSDLKVESVDGVADAADGQLLKTSFRVLVTNADCTAWVVYGLKGDNYEIKLSSAADNSAPVLGSVTAGQDTLVNVYVFYEGSDNNVHTKNLQQNKLSASQSVKINFTATADNRE
ncbi:hypothetical protein [Collinsella aerofaciens]|uniref:hypothetical protein n=1 Tax=Collinsella aerofaciens TaxID=74426 RepID=UPI0034A14002